MKNKAEVYFVLDCGNHHPEKITKFLGLEPTSIEIKGSRNIYLPKSNYWIFSTGKIQGDDFDIYDMSTTIVNKIKSKKELIIEAIKNFELTSPSLVVVYSYTTKPS